ncbi:riboflavin synthase domain-like protein [Pleurotus eryngii]|uniref:NADPH-dependent diflavin oxidoreductase 1 n=1 Tax=Pleurotus eryngii TaxID=5323 RepID=A0A9P6A8V6_PLEER|nr:riboflavin synthase domain-like protein [Pleurotus eryngii]
MGSALILYATETGTAQDAAERISRRLRCIHLKCRVVNVAEYEPTNLIAENLVIFAASTTGSGVEPRSMTPMWSMLLRSGLPDDLFEDMLFAVFGLGDTAYDKFCWPAKKLDRRLESLGAVRICERGDGDEQHPMGIDGALDPWCEKLTQSLLEIYPLQPGVEPISPNAKPNPRASFVVSSSQSLSKSSDVYWISDRQTTYRQATVTKNQRITSQDWYQDVRHFEMDFEGDLNYFPGDVAVIHPEIPEERVEEILDILGWTDDADVVYTIRPTAEDQSLPSDIPSAVSIRVLFRRHVDFLGVPRRSFFQMLRYFTTSDVEAERLDEFLSPESADELYDYCFKVRRTILEVLSEFRNVRIPKEYIFDVFPPLRPRQFSISSSIHRHPRQIHLCVAIVDYRTKLKVPRRGVCTSYLSGLAVGDKLSIGLQKGLLKLPKDPSTPIICVGPGTGIAPMRAVIEDRIHSGMVSPSTLSLYFGCRSASKDQHYRSEWEGYASKQLLNYRVACSRDGPEGAKRIYVQDLMREDSQRIWELVGECGAWVLISGSSNKMPAAVKEAVAFAAEECGGMTSEDAQEYIEEMDKTGRLIEECWS